MSVAETSNPMQLGLDARVVGALSQLYIAGERTGRGQMPHVLTGNGVRVGIEPGSQSVSLSFGDTHCILDPLEARELATMVTAAAEAVVRIEGRMPKSGAPNAPVEIRPVPPAAMNGPKSVAAE